MIPVGRITEETMMKALTRARLTERARVSDREAVRCGPVRSKWAFLAAIAAAIFVWLGVGRAALAVNAGISVADLEGRWKDDRKNLVLDISRCGGGWCGVEITGENACGRTALRMEEPPSREASLGGRLELAAEAQPYSVWARLRRNEQGLRLLITGQSGDRIEPWRRTYPFMATLARIGDVQCRPDAKVS